MGELQVVAEPPDLAAEQADPADSQVLGAPRLLEERELQGAGAVADDHLEPVDHPAAALVAVLLDVDPAHPREDGDVLVDLEHPQVGELAALGVPARVVPQQVLDRAQPQPLLERVRRTAEHLLQRVVHLQVGHGYSTPRISGQ